MPFPIDVKYIIEAEEQLGIKFPSLFKQKMMEENGGEVTTEYDDWNLYPFFDQSDKKRISRTCNHIVLETKQVRKWNNFPPYAIAIASNGCGDQLVLLPLDNDQEKLSEAIYFWYHETGALEKVAENIQELVEE